ncbi:MAG TPA: hypothetical protein PKA54_09855 [Chitinophagaceae bacterium]|nr:hypothetical protein [Chitinophagaceae bacterium]
MSNKNEKDVKDMISDFVNSKDQFLHEEIIAQIKRESFGIVDEKIGTTNCNDLEIDSALQYENVISEKEEQIKKLEEQIHQLTTNEKTSKPTQTTVAEPTATKPINSDDLRIEFLNFTSAHIQQFNVRIKKTEELIEQLSQKAQLIPTKAPQNNYPKWLQWLNIFALACISLYFILMLVFPNSNKKINSQVDINTPAQSTTEQAQTTANTHLNNAKIENAQPIAKVEKKEPTSTPKEEKLPFNTNNQKEPPSNVQVAPPTSTPSNQTANIAYSPTPLANNQTPQNISSKPVLEKKSNPNENHIVSKNVNPNRNLISKSKDDKKGKSNVPKIESNTSNNSVKNNVAAISNQVKVAKKAPTPNMTESNFQEKATAINQTPKSNPTPIKTNETKTPPKQKVYFGED